MEFTILLGLFACVFIFLTIAEARSRTQRRVEKEALCTQLQQAQEKLDSSWAPAEQALSNLHQNLHTFREDCSRAEALIDIIDIIGPWVEANRSEYVGQTVALDAEGSVLLAEKDADWFDMGIRRLGGRGVKVDPKLIFTVEEKSPAA